MFQTTDSQKSSQQTVTTVIIIAVFAVLSVIVVAIAMNTTNSGSGGGGIFSPPTFGVAYDANGGYGAPVDNNRYSAGDSVTVSYSLPSRSGYTFNGWFYNGGRYTAGQTFTMPANGVTLVAQWTENPRFSVGDGDIRTESKLSGSTCWYDIGVRNLGGDGQQTIYCHFTQGSTQITRQQTVYLRAGEYKVVTFTFPEYTFWSTSHISCRAWL
jgi:uncharacterized repeat protein (TIGR02543 family)